MQNQSKNIINGRYVPINLEAEFPFAELDYIERGIISPIPPHVHDCFEIGYCYRGTGVFLIENKIFTFKAGDAVVVNNREIHIMKSNSADQKTAWHFVNLDPVSLLGGYVMAEERFLEIETLSGPDFMNLFCSRQNQDICQLIYDIIKELEQKQDGFHSQVRALTWGLMIKLHRMMPKQKTVHNLNRLVLDRIQPALEYIADHYHEPLEVEKLAKCCYTSVSNFRKLFYKAIGIAPMVYIKQLRLKAAGVLLQNSKRSILNIATASGFPTLSNFNRQFRDYYKVSPRKWRSSR